MMKKSKISTSLAPSGAIFFSDFMRDRPVVYMLKLGIYDRERDTSTVGFKAGDWRHCDVFSTLKDAVRRGKYLIMERVERLKSKDTRCKGYSSAEYLDCRLHYSFEVRAFDPGVIVKSGVRENHATILSD